MMALYLTCNNSSLAGISVPVTRHLIFPFSNRSISLECADRKDSTVEYTAEEAAATAGVELDADGAGAAAAIFSFVVFFGGIVALVRSLDAIVRDWVSKTHHRGYIHSARSASVREQWHTRTRYERHELSHH